MDWADRPFGSLLSIPPSHGSATTAGSRFANSWRAPSGRRARRTSCASAGFWTGGRLGAGNQKSWWSKLQSAHRFLRCWGAPHFPEAGWRLCVLGAGSFWNVGNLPVSLPPNPRFTSNYSEEMRPRDRWYFTVACSSKWALVSRKSREIAADSISPSLFCFWTCRRGGYCQINLWQSGHRLPKKIPS